MTIYKAGSTIINKYLIEKILGQGAFGEVYLATHLELRAPRALKVLRKDLPGVGSTVFMQYQERFRLEARLGDMINHPNVIQVKDFDQAGNELVLAMEYAPGGSLLDWLEAARKANQPMELGRAVRMALDLGRGLSALHARDIVHRDLKPSNILFGADGSAKVGDLGVAQTPGGITQRTDVDIQTPRHPGTPDYMSPEQIATFGYLTPASDMYSLGVVLFLSLTLRNPKNLRPGTRLRALRPDAPQWLDDLLAEMLEADPAKRLFDGDELVKRLETAPPLKSNAVLPEIKPAQAPMVAPYPTAAETVPFVPLEPGPTPQPGKQAELPTRLEPPRQPDLPPELPATVVDVPAPHLEMPVTVVELAAHAKFVSESAARKSRSWLLWLLPVGLVVVALVVLLAWQPWTPSAPPPTATAPAAAEPTRAPEPTKPPEPTRALPTNTSQPTNPPAGAGCNTNRTLKVALVISLLGDKSFLDSAAAGFKMINEQFKNVQTKIIENNDVAEQQLAARAMAQQGYDLVVTVGFGSADWTTQIAKEFPKVAFAIVDSTLDVPNGTGLTFREDEGSFTVGMIAAFLNKTGKVGFVGGMDVPLLRRFELGFIQGVKYVSPKVAVVSGWVGAFNDPNKGKELALTQYAEGVDIIYAAAGKSGEGVLAASKEKNLYSIGVDSDQDYMQPGNVITSMLKRVDLSVFGVVKELVNCSLKAGNKVFGLKENGVGSTLLYNPSTIFLDRGPANMVKTLKDTAIPATRAAVEDIKSGKFCVTDFMKVFPCDKPASSGGYKP